MATNASTALVSIGKLIADPTRAEILCALMGGRAHTGNELARHVGVAASTTSEHLSKLLDAGVVTVAAQGRHRYWRLANSEIASLLETLGSNPIDLPGPTAPVELAHTRTCYDHLAGGLAVRIYDRFVGQGWLRLIEDRAELTEPGDELLATLDVDVAAMRDTRRPIARPCLDWTDRRHHLAGASGAALLDAMLDHGWIRRGKRPRSIEISREGRTAIPAALGVEIS